MYGLRVLPPRFETLTSVLHQVLELLLSDPERDSGCWLHDTTHAGSDVSMAASQPVAWARMPYRVWARAPFVLRSAYLSARCVPVGLLRRLCADLRMDVARRQLAWVLYSTAVRVVYIMQ